jgi:glycosyltransferase involved in cell wall biosynthesis
MIPPRFTVIVPCHNAAATIDATLDSVEAQTYRDFEVVVVDDGSTDDSRAHVIRRARATPWLCLSRQHRQGVSAARNAGAAAASGEILVFLDADDLLMPAALQVLSDVFHDRPDAVGAIGRVSFLTPDGLPTGTVSAVPPPHLRPTDILGENPACTGSNIIVRRTAFLETGGFHEGLTHAEDQEFLFRLGADGYGPIIGLPDVLAGYRCNPGGAHANLAAMEKGWERMVAAAAERHPAIVANGYCRAKARHLRMLARRALRDPASAGLALHLLGRSLRRDPRLLFDIRRTLPTLAAALIAAVPLPRCRRWVSRLAA